ncbi:hypothetical protein K3758_12080 [Sulfitobacter sp. W002]|uniref:hypothetical protein n=1 Tax=Sulfitobacter sp. W002 TaxID=2867024 RepID=UPI0021A4554E|nr:hypothetical protein [Sulfitobacter sp. W002]UWR29100.1 hypothetical protein K3758_12080 [Sulfitobacter sp. W002]
MTGQRSGKGRGGYWDIDQHSIHLIGQPMAKPRHTGAAQKFRRARVNGRDGYTVIFGDFDRPTPSDKDLLRSDGKRVVNGDS